MLRRLLGCGADRRIIAPALAAVQPRACAAARGALAFPAMTGRAGGLRLRQAVIAATELEPVALELQRTLGLPEPFRDPNVAEFGLHNAVFAIGDCFLEIISPTGPGTAAGRWLQRHGGDGGYMAIFDLEDLDGARERRCARRARRLADRPARHLRDPPASSGHARRDRLARPLEPIRKLAVGRARLDRPHRPGRGSRSPERDTVAVADPAASASRWGEVLGRHPEAEDPVLALDGGRIAFEQAPGAAGEGISEITVERDGGLPAGADSASVGGVRIRCSPPATGHG